MAEHAAGEDFRDAKYDANMKRIAKIYENASLSEDQKVELLLQMETEAKREINELNSEISPRPTTPRTQHFIARPESTPGAALLDPGPLLGLQILI